MKKYDYIVVGGGAAGCVLASRLSEDPSVTVLLLESGSERRTPLLAVPAGEVLLMGNPAYDWCFKTESDPTLHQRAVQIPRGKLLGGSNTINGLIFVRGQRQDFDEWAQAGNHGWSWSDVLPYFKKLERASGFTGPSRGQDGPIHVALPRERDALCDAFLGAAVERGHALNPDYNSGDQEGFGYYQVTHDEGRRSSALGGYLKGARQRANLTVWTEAHVSRLIFEGRRCVGVEFTYENQIRQAKCHSEVIVSAGAIQSPQLLELSGIGSESVLRSAGITVRHALPGVGKNFRDHFAVRMKWRVTQPITFNERTRGLALFKEVAQYLLARKGVLSLPIALGYGFVRSSPAETRPDLQFHFAPASYGPHSTRRLDTAPGMTLGVYKLRPESQGSIHIRSADPRDRPLINPNFMADESDRQCLVAGMRIARDIVSSTTLDPYRAQELTPGIEQGTDEQLTEFARSLGDTSYHPIGTCRMGCDANAVVDHRLRVHGIAGLRVIDASVMPSFISGNTNAATLMIAEKGAAMVQEDRKAQSNFGLAA